MTLFGKAVFSIIVLMVVGGGYYAYKTKNSAVPTTSAQVEVKNNQPQGIAVGEPNPSAPATGKKMAFSQLVEQKGTYKCTVNQYVGSMETKGTVYMSEGMIRAEFSTTMQGKMIETSMIARDGYTYSWTSMMPTMGYKTKMTQPQAGGVVDTKAQTSGSYSWNAEQIGDYNCEAWTADSSKFEIPKTINFTSVN